MYHLDDSYDSSVPQQRIAAHAANQTNKAMIQKAQLSTGDHMTLSGGRTADTSGNHYFASRQFAASFALDPETQTATQIDGSARKKQTISGQNALLSLISMDDFEGIRNQIHSKIVAKIDENPASEEEEEKGV